MEHIVRKDIKQCEEIYPHPHHWIFCGHKFQSCSKQGGPVFTYQEVKPAIYTLANLPNNRLLLEDDKCTLHLLDLDKGIVVASQKLTKKREIRSRFAVSNDGATAFYSWNWGNKMFLCKIDLPDLTYHVYNYKATLRCIRDIVFNAENQLLVLESQNDLINEKFVSPTVISSVSIQDDSCNITQLYRWDGPYVSKCMDGEYVLLSNYSVRELSTQKTISLLENNDVPFPHNFAPISYHYYPEYNCLQLVNIRHNVFIDCEKRKIIACYRNDIKKLIFSGVCTGDEFWIGKPDGIYAKPFPMFEE